MIDTNAINGVIVAKTLNISSLSNHKVEFAEYPDIVDGRAFCQHLATEFHKIAKGQHEAPLSVISSGNLIEHEIVTDTDGRQSDRHITHETLPPSAKEKIGKLADKLSGALSAEIDETKFKTILLDCYAELDHEESLGQHYCDIIKDIFAMVFKDPLMGEKEQRTLQNVEIESFRKLQSDLATELDAVRNLLVALSGHSDSRKEGKGGDSLIDMTRYIKPELLEDTGRKLKKEGGHPLKIYRFKEPKILERLIKNLDVAMVEPNITRSRFKKALRDAYELLLPDTGLEHLNAAHERQVIEAAFEEIFPKEIFHDDNQKISRDFWRRMSDDTQTQFEELVSKMGIIINQAEYTNTLPRTKEQPKGPFRGKAKSIVGVKQDVFFNKPNLPELKRNFDIIYAAYDECTKLPGEYVENVPTIGELKEAINTIGAMLSPHKDGSFTLTLIMTTLKAGIEQAQGISPHR